jgi:hypothetical protein
LIRAQRPCTAIRLAIAKHDGRIDDYKHTFEAPIGTEIEPNAAPANANQPPPPPPSCFVAQKCEACVHHSPGSSYEDHEARCTIGRVVKRVLPTLPNECPNFEPQKCDRCTHLQPEHDDRAPWCNKRKIPILRSFESTCALWEPKEGA